MMCTGITRARRHRRARRAVRSATSTEARHSDVGADDDDQTLGTANLATLVFVGSKKRKAMGLVGSALDVETRMRIPAPPWWLIPVLIALVVACKYDPAHSETPDEWWKLVMAIEQQGARLDADERR